MYVTLVAVCTALVVLFWGLTCDRLSSLASLAVASALVVERLTRSRDLPHVPTIALFRYIDKSVPYFLPQGFAVGATVFAVLFAVSVLQYLLHQNIQASAGWKGATAASFYSLMVPCTAMFILSDEAISMDRTGVVATVAFFCFVPVLGTQSMYFVSLATVLSFLVRSVVPCMLASSAPCQVMRLFDEAISSKELQLMFACHAGFGAVFHFLLRADTWSKFHSLTLSAIFASIAAYVLLVSFCELIWGGYAFAPGQELTNLSWSNISAYFQELEASQPLDPNVDPRVLFRHSTLPVCIGLSVASATRLLFGSPSKLHVFRTMLETCAGIWLGVVAWSLSNETHVTYSSPWFLAVALAGMQSTCSFNHGSVRKAIIQKASRFQGLKQTDKEKSVAKYFKDSSAMDAKVHAAALRCVETDSAFEQMVEKFASSPASESCVTKTKLALTYAEAAFAANQLSKKVHQVYNEAVFERSMVRVVRDSSKAQTGAKVSFQPQVENAVARCIRLEHEFSHVRGAAQAKCGRAIQMTDEAFQLTRRVLAAEEVDIAGTGKPSGRKAVDLVAMQRSLIVTRKQLDEISKQLRQKPANRRHTPHSRHNHDKQVTFQREQKHAHDDRFVAMSAPVMQRPRPAREPSNPELQLAPEHRPSTPNLRPEALALSPASAPGSFSREDSSSSILTDASSATRKKRWPWSTRARSSITKSTSMDVARTQSAALPNNDEKTKKRGVSRLRLFSFKSRKSKSDALATLTEDPAQ